MSKMSKFLFVHLLLTIMRNSAYFWIKLEGLHRCWWRVLVTGVGDGCWKRFGLVITLNYKWPIRGSHQHNDKRRIAGTNPLKLSTSYCRQHNVITNITVAKLKSSQGPLNIKNDHSIIITPRLGITLNIIMNIIGVSSLEIGHMLCFTGRCVL